MFAIDSLFADGPEYLERKCRPFEPPKISLAEVHAAIPPHLREISTLKGLYYLSRDILFGLLFYRAALYIPIAANYASASLGLGQPFGLALRATLWVCYWFWQGVLFAGFWCLAHEAGHGTMSPHKAVNSLLGFTLHTFLLVPYYSWRSTHRTHHKGTASLERDENYLPRTRSEYGLPSPAKATPIDYREIFEDAPLYILLRMLLMQLLGWHAYLLYNALGNQKYPAGTNHFSPSSPLFKLHERTQIMASNIGIAAMAALLGLYAHSHGFLAFINLYLIPYLLANHWIVMLTFIQHSDPTIPHYRGASWSFLRGSLATVDRPLLGWIGRLFLHNISHDHIAHHLFSSIPFYNQPQVTECLKSVLKEHYNYDSTNTFRVLYRSFTECCFIEDEGDIVFYKNQDGVAQRELKEDVDSGLESNGSTD
ncbi:delta-12 fatty acid desaturase protein [Gloeophyllum trabeum ATCC 11539]|uniref:Delta-12 fatty acid desaturase protein n=1 Tax=Gloeophyllum trabeum (strain ATCC 11539 / FP-39264 / Madison 617) TaxID=670483 RepID=S7QAX0_GLOTA|nr:delta-12 fatty acid desaturase protein [Gloeophyllum trabeum ATCC 11539]EPQ57061.1 delta-12 fatty acid desaturase protein [Gloeophyllum trabeum ATCC 11539]